MHKPEDKLLAVAKVIKSFGSGEEVIIRYTLPDPEIVVEKPVFLLFEGLPVPFFIETIRDRGENQSIVKFYDTKYLYRELPGKDIYIPHKKSSSKSKDYHSNPELLTGFKLISPKGEALGIVKGFEDFPGNPCLKISLFVKEDKEVLVPFHEDIILKIKTGRKEIIASLPDGLLEL
ncbi:MAG: hypothetical protein PHP30_05865 [Bacteroidales bacterium]|nr:hypothetical protein [Bacteroidales bacterium]MDD2425149.1 hypothetical protein [Bacteroidales bacterium]MDD3989604.1 hypothetical protein [Bacteroidales bacterium]MDD4638841.1 hypothetical protein [Bacteroidales bacterium]